MILYGYPIRWNGKSKRASGISSALLQPSMKRPIKKCALDESFFPDPSVTAHPIGIFAS